MNVCDWAPGTELNKSSLSIWVSLKMIMLLQGEMPLEFYHEHRIPSANKGENLNAKRILQWVLSLSKRDIEWIDIHTLLKETFNFNTLGKKRNYYSL